LSREICMYNFSVCVSVITAGTTGWAKNTACEDMGTAYFLLFLVTQVKLLLANMAVCKTSYFNHFWSESHR